MASMAGIDSYFLLDPSLASDMHIRYIVVAHWEIWARRDGRNRTFALGLSLSQRGLLDLATMEHEIFCFLCSLLLSFLC